MLLNKTQKVFETQGDDIVALSASGTGAVECSGVINLVKKDDKIIIPVNGEFSNRRLAQLIEWSRWTNVIRTRNSEPGQNATFDQVKEAFDNNKDVKAFYVCSWNETSTGTMVNYLDKI